MNTLLHTTAGTRHLRLDPRTKLLLLFTTSFTLIWAGYSGGMMSVLRPFFALLPCVLLLFSKRWRTGLICGLILVACLIAEKTLVYTTTGMLNFLLVPVCAIFTRFVPCIFAAYYMMATTTVSEFTAGMERIHMPQKIVIPLSVMFRFFPTVLEEQRYIRDAMRMRNITAANPVTMLEYRVVPLVATVAKIGEELSMAALTRGLGGDVKRSNVCEIGLGIQDILIILIALGCSCIFILVRVGML